MEYPKSEADWLALRHQYVSSTESAALFGLSPYLTAFELATIKKAKEPQSFESNERMAWGLRLQEAIAKGVSEDYGVKVRRVRGYAIQPDYRLGASFDYEIVGIQRDEAGEERQAEDPMLQQMYRDLGPGILEVKNVDAYVFRNDWQYDKDTQELEAPPHFEIQVQHQLAAIQTRRWSAIAVLVGGNTAKLVLREMDEEFIPKIVDKVAGFWKLLDSGGMPPVVLPADVELLRHIYLASTPGKVHDGQADAELTRLCEDYDAARDLAKTHEEARKSLGVRILMKIGDAEVGLASGYKISAGTVSAAQIPAYTRAAFRNCRVTKLRTRSEAK
jgi:predicted phage-related endonuclease